MIISKRHTSNYFYDENIGFESNNAILLIFLKAFYTGLTQVKNQLAHWLVSQGHEEKDLGGATVGRTRLEKSTFGLYLDVRLAVGYVHLS